MTNKKNYTGRASGFTLVEVMVAGALISVLGASFVGLQYILFRSQISSVNSIVSVNESNTAIAQITRELRTVRIADSGAYPFEYADDNELVFYSNVDGDESAEKVRYFIEGGSLKKTVINPAGSPATYPAENGQTRIITDNIRNGELPMFVYFNDAWPQDIANNPLPTPADPDEIRLIKVHIRVNTKDDPDTDYVLESFAHTRTLKTNL